MCGHHSLSSSLGPGVAIVKGLNGVGWLLPIEVVFDPRASG